MMNRPVLAVLLLTATVALAGMLAFRAEPVTAQDPESGGPKHVTSRYRLCVVQTELDADEGGAPLRLTQFGETVEAAVGPISPEASAAGYFGAVRHPPGILGAIRERWPGAKVLFRGEVEGYRGQKISLTSGRRFPIVTRDLRGDQLIATTKFERVGVKLELTRTEDWVHSAMLEFSAVSAWGRGGQPVIFEVTSRGPMLLPDGATAVFSFVDRVNGAELGSGPERGASDAKAEVPQDILVRFFALITRLDLSAR